LAAGVRAAASTASGAVAFQGEDGALLAACLGQPARPAMTLPSPLPDLVRDLILRQGEPIVPEALVPALAACGAGDVLLAPTGGGELMLAHPRYRIFARAMSALREAEARGVSQRDGGFHEAPISARELWHGAAGGMDEAERLSILGPALMHTAVLAASRAYGTTLCDATSDCVMAEAARLDLEMRLPARDLVALDVAATYTGAAIICPFLDSEWAATLAGRPDRERRWLLPTQSSIAPDLSAWHPMGPALRGFTQDILQGSACRERDLFSRGQIDALLRRHAAKPGIEAGGLWALLGIELWCQVFLDAPAQLARPPRDEMDEQLLAITRRAA